MLSVFGKGLLDRNSNNLVYNNIGMNFILFVSIIHLSLFIVSPFDTDLVPTKEEIVVTEVSQYHFLPVQSFFQYSLANWESNQPDQTQILQQVIISYGINFINTAPPQYNIIVLQTNASNFIDPYKEYNCYLRALNEGVQELMQECDLGNNYTASNGSCSGMIASSAANFFQNTNTFLNCTDTVLNYNITPSHNQNKGGLFNGTILFIIDNSGLLFNFTSPILQMNIILTSQIIAIVDTQQKAKTYLACGLLGIFIMVLTIVAFIINFKIKRYEKHIQRYSKQKVV